MRKSNNKAFWNFGRFEKRSSSSEPQLSLGRESHKEIKMATETPQWMTIAKIVIGRGKTVVGVIVYFVPDIAFLFGHPMTVEQKNGWQQAAVLVGGVGIVDKAGTFLRWILSDIN